MEHTVDKKEIVIQYCIITFGAFLVAAAISLFMIPGNLVFGSVSGLSFVLTHFIPLPVSVINLILNLFFLLIGFIFVGKILA